MEVIAQDKLSDEDELHILRLTRGEASPSLTLQWESTPSLFYFPSVNAGSFGES